MDLLLTLLCALGLELFPKHVGDILRRELDDKSPTFTTAAFVRIVRQCARAKRALGLTLLAECRLLAALRAVPELAGLSLEHAAVSRRALYHSLNSAVLGADLLEAECIALTLAAPGPNLLQQYGIGMNPTTL